MCGRNRLGILKLLKQLKVCDVQLARHFFTLPPTTKKIQRFEKMEYGTRIIRTSMLCDEKKKLLESLNISSDIYKLPAQLAKYLYQYAKYWLVKEDASD